MELRLSEPQEYIVTSTQSILLFLAGVGSGKTHIIGFKSGYFIKKFPKVFGFIGANTYMQLSQSTLFRVQSVWKQIYGWEEGIDFVVDKKPPKSFETTDHQFKSYSGIISFKTGAVVFVGSLDNAKAHDGKEFGWAFLDETKDSREEDVKDVIFARLRSPGIFVGPDYQLTSDQYDEDFNENEAFNPLYILTSPAKVLWINEWFELDEHQHEILSLIYDKENFFTKEFGDKCVVISSTCHNEENLPKGYIRRQVKNRSEEKAKMLIYGNPFVRTGGEFYSGFERLRHVRKCPFKPGLPIHVSLDQNVVPYITMTLYQIEYLPSGIVEVTQFDEICLENPKNTTAKLALEFIKRWGVKCKGLFYYGDPSGRKRDTRANEHDYKIFARVLKRYLTNKSDRVPYKHPGVLKRKDFANDIFEENHDIRFYIDPKCKKSIADFEFLKEDANGKKGKEMFTDPVTNVRYEKYGHTSDSFDYFICKVFEKLFKANYK